ncbi:MAG: protein kinase [Lachnospiraceae bacterium]|nr:protein kinase [Lachnospiraceae bacterium]
MPGKVFFEVTMGALEGQVFTYEEADRVFVGRSDDCGVILPEKTVSRYHCLLNINPPTVKLQDFGSLNGTYLNEQIIGRRERTQTREEAGGEAHDEYELHDGDRIRLGKSCELRCRIELPEPEMDEPDPDGTMVEPQDGGMTMPEPGRRMRTEDGEAGDEKARREAEEARKEAEAARKEAERQAEEARREAERLVEEARREAEAARKEAERMAEEARKEAERKAKEEAAQKEAELRKEAEQRMAAALKEAAARREAEQKAEEARREAERKAEEARKEAERKKEAARKEAERKAEEARKEAERKKEAARKEAERKAEEARKEAERKKEAARREAERLAEEARKEAERRAEEERRRKAEEEKQAAAMKPARRNCRGCGKLFTPTAPDNNLCTDCLKDQGKILDDILMALIGGALAQQGEKLEASPVEGYDKVGLLGKGGMGEVWKVREKKTGKILALKTMLPEIAADRKAKNMFLREAGICEFLKHKNVVRTYQTGCADGVFYILMDLCGGGSVEDLMKRSGGKLSLNLATYIILQVLDGLDYVHKLELTVEIKKKGLFGGKQTVNVKGVVHRDFKPGNIFLSDHSDHPVAMVADFGMAKAFETAGLTDMSAPGEAKGTVPFMPRQQVLDCRYAKPEVDVWAAAASYYNMLTGDFPKNLKPGPLLWQGLVTESAVPIRRRDPSIPAGVAQVIDQALIEKPQIGFQSAAEFRRKLAAALPADTKKYCKMLLR